MNKEEIKDLEEIKSYFKYTCDSNIEYFIKVIDQLQQENESLKDTIRINNCVNESGIIQNQSAKIAELEEENKKQKEILDILKQYLYVDTINGSKVIRALIEREEESNREDFNKIKEWLENDK